MSTVFVSQEVWPRLTKAARGSRQPCSVAVAYFGAGASRLLPLPKGSRLVVDASERSVAAGQTCPADLTKLVKRGVTVYSVPNLHAKVFVFGSAAYVGSANVSCRSASQLVEAVIRTNDAQAVRAAREFVHQHCLHELTPELLKRLSKLYRPPIVPGGRRGVHRQVAKSTRPSLPRLMLAQLQLEDWPDKDQALHDAEMVVAKKRREHPRSFELDSFRIPGRCAYHRGDVVVQVTDEGRDAVFVSPPGNVLHVRSRRFGKRQVSFIFLERPLRRRRRLKNLARALGRGAQKQLARDGAIRNAAFVEALQSAWADQRA